MKRILFLGDSITDCSHCFTSDNLGNGYVRLMADRLNGSLQTACQSYDTSQLIYQPDGLIQTSCERNRSSQPSCQPNASSQLTCQAEGSTQPAWFVINGGSDGFTFPAICRKWRHAWAAEQFDAVSILGGVNDVGCLMDSGLSEGGIQSRLLESELALRTLLDGLLAQRTPVILLSEPFLFPRPDYLRTWMGRLEQLRAILRRAAKRSAAIHLIALQPALDAYARQHGLSRVTTDGIHLTPDGHRIVCDRILEALQSAQ